MSELIGSGWKILKYLTHQPICQPPGIAWAVGFFMLLPVSHLKEGRGLYDSAQEQEGRFQKLPCPVLSIQNDGNSLGSFLFTL